MMQNDHRSVIVSAVGHALPSCFLVSAVQIVKMAMEQFGSLTEYIRIASSSCVACFIMESRDGMKVVAMGSGTGYYTECFQPEDPDGNLVMDGHAEVLARRSLLRFLYTEMDKVQAGKRSIFEPAAGGLFQLSSDVYFHLYISVLPCGDAKMFSVNDANFLRPLQGIHCHNGCGHPLPSYGDINGPRILYLRAFFFFAPPRCCPTCFGFSLMPHVGRRALAIHGSQMRRPSPRTPRHG